MWRSDTVLGLATAVLAACVAGLSLAIEVNAAHTTLSARFLPLTLSIVLFGLSALLAVRPGETRLSAVAGQLLIRRGLLLAAVVAVYFITFGYVDFRIGSWLFMLAAMWALGARRPAELIVIPPLVAATVYAVFRYGFSVLLPTWI